ncbi:hypothetical protein [Bdellovibrio sp. HCB-162]|uniref:hypothetical protein n=1 Tax=Bdellovibrio sp. HCB-162 TaxID=3394234 RepID=UPI0039BC493C
MFKKILIFALAVTALSLNAQADQHFVGARQFADMIEKYKEACAQTCQKPFREAVLYKNGKNYSAFLSNGEMIALQKIAFRQSYIWADTILEGDFYADGNTVLTEVIGIFRGSNLVGYKIAYAERAWETSACDFDGEDMSTLDSCTEGVIRETSYVSKDLKTFIRNHDDIAEFYN